MGQYWVNVKWVQQHNLQSIHKSPPCSSICQIAILETALNTPVLHLFASGLIAISEVTSISWSGTCADAQETVTAISWPSLQWSPTCEVEGIDFSLSVRYWVQMLLSCPISRRFLDTWCWLDKPSTSQMAFAERLWKALRLGPDLSKCHCQKLASIACHQDHHTWELKSPKRNNINSWRSAGQSAF